MKRHVTTLTVMIAVTVCANGYAQDETGDAAKEAQNPLANVISMPLQNNTDFGIGTYDKTGNVLNIQPIVPKPLGDNGWLLINRFIIPFPKTVPDASTQDGQSTTGLGDISYTVWFAPPVKGSFTWGFGAVTIWPTATADVLGQDKFSIGPSFVFVYANPGWLGAAVIADWKSVAGDDTKPDVHTFYFQYILTYFLPDRWYVTSAPIILANWEAAAGQKWTVPFGAGLGKMFNAGKLPLDLQVSAYGNAVKPDGAAEWQLRVQLKFIFPTGKK